MILTKQIYVPPHVIQNFFWFFSFSYFLHLTFDVQTNRLDKQISVYGQLLSHSVHFAAKLINYTLSKTLQTQTFETSISWLDPDINVIISFCSNNIEFN